MKRPAAWSLLVRPEEDTVVHTGVDPESRFVTDGSAPRLRDGNEFKQRTKL